MKGQVIQSRIESNLSFWAGGLFEEGNVSQEQCNQGKTKSYLSSDSNIGEIDSIFDIFHIPPSFLNWNAIAKNKIPKSKLVVNTKR